MAGNSNLKTVTIRWPRDFWRTVAKATKDDDTSIQALVTAAVAEKLGLPHPGENRASEAA